MRFVVTSVQEHHLRSWSANSAVDGVEFLEICQKEGYEVILILDHTYRRLTPVELRRLAVIESIADMLD